MTEVVGGLVAAAGTEPGAADRPGSVSGKAADKVQTKQLMAIRLN